jgi:protoporphyrinogen oxidase
LSITKAIGHAVKKLFKPPRSFSDQQKGETSLIEQFMYPKLGPGHLWEEVARLVVRKGGEVRLHQEVVGICQEGGRVTAVRVRDAENGTLKEIAADYVISSMPVKDLVRAFDPELPKDVRAVSDQLMYRDFITVGVLVRKLKIRNQTKVPTVNDIIPDNWIYVQEADVRMGRIQIFNNWSPYMVRDDNTVWLGLEYFCNEGDDFWQMPEAEMSRLAVDELIQIGFIHDRADVLDRAVVHTPKAYPSYYGAYDRFDEVRACLDAFPNLFLIGRNGMHRYNNSDHSMMTAMVAVENIRSGSSRKDNIWAVNMEKQYHE